MERFWEKVEKRGPGECWLWTGSTTAAKGFRYGVWNFWDIAYKVHRVAYSLVVGPIPEGLTLDHVVARGCRSKLCCNPAHLEPVTQSVNSLRQFSNPDRLYPLACKRGHAKEWGADHCRRCLVVSVAKSQAKRPAYYREMKRRNKAAERARKA